jgi:hypothetical protein
VAIISHIDTIDKAILAVELLLLGATHQSMENKLHSKRNERFEL